MSCSGNLRYTLEIVKRRIFAIFDDTIDVSRVTKEHIKNSASKIPVTCNICQYSWEPSVSSIARGHRGCSGCSDNIPYTLGKLVSKGRLIHGERYDYSRVREDHIKSSKSKVPIVCRPCGREFLQSISSHINGKAGCSFCNRSRGEIECERILKEKFNLPYVLQFSYDDYPRWRYDGSFIYNGVTYRLEFDGVQHFIFHAYFHKTYDIFMASQERDVLKTVNVIRCNDRIIRIDHTQENNIEFHIRNAIDSNQLVYVSNGEIYGWLLDGVKKELNMN